MAERLVDVLNSHETVLQTVPVTLEGADDGSRDVEYEEKAAAAAVEADLVPDSEVAGLTARMHVSRRGMLKPYGDDRARLSRMRERREEVVRERAYLLWEEEGRPPGRTDEYWHRAHDQHLRERAYALWQQEGSADGQAEEYWARARRLDADGTI